MTRARSPTRAFAFIPSGYLHATGAPVHMVAGPATPAWANAAWTSAWAPEDLAKHQVIALSREFRRLPLVVWFDSIVPDSAIFVRHHNVPGLFTGLRAGLGVSIMSDLVASTDPTLIPCFVPPPNVDSALDLWLVTTERLRNEPRIRALMDFLASYFAQAKYKGA